MRDYTVYYKDGSYLTYTLDDDQYQRLCNATIARHSALIEGVGLFMTEDIRSIILQLVTDEELEDNPSYDPELTDEDKEWVRAIDLAAKLHEEYESKVKDDDDDDTDYEGGMMV